MRKLLVLFSALLIAISAMAAGRTLALVVGVQTYEDTTANNRYKAKEAQLMKKVLGQETKHISVLTSKYATADNIIEKLQALCNRADKDDKIIFTYCGHGYPGGLYVHDGPLPYTRLNKVLESSKAGAKICIVEACYAGTVVDGQSTASGPDLSSAASNNIVYVMAARPDEPSWNNGWLQRDIFTQAVLKGLQGKADSNGDKKVTVSEVVYNYAYQEVMRRAKNMEIQQHPQLLGSKKAASEVIIDWNHEPAVK